MGTLTTTRILLAAVVAITTCCHGGSASRSYDKMRVDQMWHHFGCDEIFQEPRPIHSVKDWTIMRQAYQEVVGMDRSSLVVSTGHGFYQNVGVDQSADKGRGVFVTAPIPKGELVWTTTMTARFDNGKDYRKFLASIRPDLACDVLQWAYVQSLPSATSKTEKAFISVDLDEGSFINSFEEWVEIYDEEVDEYNPNLGCDPVAAKKFKGGCKTNYFALRDLEVGEELLLDYSDFAIQEGWRWFGL